MYARKRTWLERGPAPAPRCGLGNILTDAPDCASPWSLLDPAAWAQCWGYDAGTIYEKVQYGHIPRAGELPQPGAAGVPTDGGLTPGITPAQQAAYVASQQAALDAAAANGSWNSGGNLPVTADDVSKVFEDHSTAIIVGVCAVAAVALFSFGKGRL